MAKFISDEEINSELAKLIQEAEGSIILISPFIRLHERLKSILLDKAEHDIEVTILIGKNEDDISKSLTCDDFLFFKQFPNIEILYEKDLHAKYYANERKAIITSMNLYDYSQNNNFESGILLEKSIKGMFTGVNTLEEDAWNYFDRIISQAEPLFIRKPIHDQGKLLGKRKYLRSENEVNVFIEDSLDSKSKTPNKIETSKGANGFCIRTGISIPFNIEKPFSYKAYKSWSQFKNKQYPEKYCHSTGEESEGKTSAKYPILKKNRKTGVNNN